MPTKPSAWESNGQYLFLFNDGNMCGIIFTLKFDFNLVLQNSQIPEEPVSKNENQLVLKI